MRTTRPRPTATATPMVARQARPPRRPRRRLAPRTPAPSALATPMALAGVVVLPLLRQTAVGRLQARPPIRRLAEATRSRVVPVAATTALAALATALPLPPATLAPATRPLAAATTAMAALATAAAAARPAPRGTGAPRTPRSQRAAPVACRR